MDREKSIFVTGTFRELRDAPDSRRKNIVSCVGFLWSLDTRVIVALSSPVFTCVLTLFSSSKCQDWRNFPCYFSRQRTRGGFTVSQYLNRSPGKIRYEIFQGTAAVSVITNFIMRKRENLQMLLYVQASDFQTLSHPDRPLGGV